MAGINKSWHHPGMVKKVQPRFKSPRPRFFFREWRKHRGHTQEALADMIGVTTSTISQLETGKQGFTDSTLIALADALKCSPGDLLMRNPLDADAPWSIWDNIKPEDRPQAIRTLESFVASRKAG
jgi:transcriptional regulator with XRE-family HTH domain